MAEVSEVSSGKKCRILNSKEEVGEGVSGGEGSMYCGAMLYYAMLKMDRQSCVWIWVEVL